MKDSEILLGALQHAKALKAALEMAHMADWKYGGFGDTFAEIVGRIADDIEFAMECAEAEERYKGA